MTELARLPALMPLLPELVLACGAMLMLMVGVASASEHRRGVNGWC